MPTLGPQNPITWTTTDFTGYMVGEDNSDLTSTIDNSDYIG